MNLSDLISTVSDRRLQPTAIIVSEDERHMICQNGVHEFVPCDYNNCDQCSLYSKYPLRDRSYDQHCYPGKANRYCDYLQRRDKNAGHWKHFVIPKRKEYTPPRESSQEEIDIINQLL